MPRIARTIVPRIRKSVEERGVMVTLARSVFLPWHLLKEYRAARGLRRERAPNEKSASEFDVAHGVETEGEFEGWTYLSDLEIDSRNWIHGNNYAAVEPERFGMVMAAVASAMGTSGEAGREQEIGWQDYTFVDFGSGKGRALLLASEYPFRKIVGLEFSRELHEAAVENVRRYSSETQKCRVIEPRVADFVDYEFPAERLVLFFFDPCDERVLGQVMEKLSKSIQESPRAVYVAYVGPRGLELKIGTMERLFVDREHQIAVYASRL